jgi:hypothetical protein
MIFTSECRALGEGAITTYFKRPRFVAAGPSRAQIHNLQDAKREHYHLANDIPITYSYVFFSVTHWLAILQPDDQQLSCMKNKM